MVGYCDTDVCHINRLNNWIKSSNWFTGYINITIIISCSNRTTKSKLGIAHNSSDTKGHKIYEYEIKLTKSGKIIYTATLTIKVASRSKYQQGGGRKNCIIDSVVRIYKSDSAKRFISFLLLTLHLFSYTILCVCPIHQGFSIT